MFQASEQYRFFLAGKGKRCRPQPEDHQDGIGEHSGKEDNHQQVPGDGCF